MLFVIYFFLQKCNKYTKQYGIKGVRKSIFSVLKPQLILTIVALAQRTLDNKSIHYYIYRLKYV